MATQNRFGGLDLFDDDGEIVKQPKQSKQQQQTQQQSQQSTVAPQGSRKATQAPVESEVTHERTERGRGGRGRGRGNRGGRGGRGGYHATEESDGTQRQFERRGYRGQYERGQARKNGLGLGSAEQPEAADAEPTAEDIDATTDAVEELNVNDEAVQDDEAVEEEDDGNLTYDQYLEQQRQKRVAEDEQRELRSAQVDPNDKNFRKAKEVTSSKSKLPPNLQHATTSQTTTPKEVKQVNKKQILSLNEFVGPDARLRPIRDDAEVKNINTRGRGSFRGESRGRGERGGFRGESRGDRGGFERRGGRGAFRGDSSRGEHRGRGGYRGGYSGGNRINVNDEQSFPSLGAPQ